MTAMRTKQSRVDELTALIESLGFVRETKGK